MAAEASDGSMERIITTLNEMEPIITTANESALPPPGKVGIWDQIRRHIDPVSKVASALSSMLLTAWGVSLLIGGGFFLRYYGSIGFMPEVDVDTSVTLLVGSAMTGIATLLALGVTLLMPAWLWGEMIRKSPALKECWSTCDGKVLPERVIAWLSWPACVVLGGAMVGYLFIEICTYKRTVIAYGV